MIKEQNTRITITIRKDQATWLKKFCKKIDTTPSMYIKYLLSCKGREQDLYERLEKQTGKSKEEIQRIANTPLFD